MFSCARTVFCARVDEWAVPAGDDECEGVAPPRSGASYAGPAVGGEATPLASPVRLPLDSGVPKMAVDDPGMRSGDEGGPVASGSPCGLACPSIAFGDTLVVHPRG